MKVKNKDLTLELLDLQIENQHLRSLLLEVAVADSIEGTYVDLPLDLYNEIEKVLGYDTIAKGIDNYYDNRDNLS